jgi:hypothetical protein
MTKLQRKSLVGWTYDNYDWSIERIVGHLTINGCGVNIVTSKYRESNDFYITHYPKRVRITIEELPTTKRKDGGR